jgi:nitrite reductase/ring-hydroxylating ferredoxin subunit
MTRKEFIETVGFATGTILMSACMGACTKDDTATTPAGTVLLTLNLADAANVTLKTKGNYLVKDNVVVARDVNGNYLAVTVVCSHEGKKQVTYNKTTDEWLCTAHDARFNKTTGKGLNSTGNKGITVYKTTVVGDVLTVTA